MIAVFETPEQVVSALKRYRDVFDPESSSLITVSRIGFDPFRDPFRGDFLSRIDQREELRRRLADCLPPRNRVLLFLWYVADFPVSRITRMLGISRGHCYRLRKESIAMLCDDPAEAEEESTG